MKVWVTRDGDDALNVGTRGSVAIWDFSEKPVKSDKCWIGDGNLFDGRVRDARSVLGFTPRKGSCKQYELTLKEIK